jgi:hypothetical protein
MFGMLVQCGGVLVGFLSKLTLIGGNEAQQLDKNPN